MLEALWWARKLSRLNLTERAWRVEEDHSIQHDDYMCVMSLRRKILNKWLANVIITGSLNADSHSNSSVIAELIVKLWNT